MNTKSSNVIVVPLTHNKSKLPYLVPITPVFDANGEILLDGQVDTAYNGLIVKTKKYLFLSESKVWTFLSCILQ